ncbi:hypothetical protein I3F55_24430, partial [Streptomyces sp. MUM 16J]|nr:hypothetical protein [Streptomyces sp. MUM 16J]
PSGFTYDRADRRLNTCSAQGWGQSYHLRTPKSGLWACTVPSGFSYDQSYRRLNTCNPEGWGYSFRLRG